MDLYSRFLCFSVDTSSRGLMRQGQCSTGLTSELIKLFIPILEMIFSQIFTSQSLRFEDLYCLQHSPCHQNLFEPGSETCPVPSVTYFRSIKYVTVTAGWKYRLSTCVLTHNIKACLIYAKKIQSPFWFLELSQASYTSHFFQSSPHSAHQSSQ